MSVRAKRQRLMIAGLCVVLSLILFGAVILESASYVCVYTVSSVCALGQSGCGSNCSYTFQISWGSLPILLQLAVAVVLLGSAGAMFL
jgi:hypothetical protein